MILHNVELEQDRIIIVGVGQDEFILELGLNEIFVCSWYRAGLVQIGKETVFV